MQHLTRRCPCVRPGSVGQREPRWSRLSSRRLPSWLIYDQASLLSEVHFLSEGEHDLRICEGASGSPYCERGAPDTSRCYVWVIHGLFRLTTVPGKPSATAHKVEIRSLNAFHSTKQMLRMNWFYLGNWDRRCYHCTWSEVIAEAF